MLHGLLGMLVPGLVIFFPVVRGGGAMRVRSKFVELRSSLVRIIWHGISAPRQCSILELFDFVNCSILYVCGKARIFSRRISDNPANRKLAGSGCRYYHAES